MSSNIAKSVSVVIPRCNDALKLVPKRRRENHEVGCAFWPHIKGIAQVPQLSVVRPTLRPIDVAFARLRPSEPLCIDTLKNHTSTKSQPCSYCLLSCAQTTYSIIISTC